MARLATVCVYAASRDNLAPEYAVAARRLGETLASQGRRLVYGGGRAGLMGVIADAVLAGGGEVVGVMPRQLDTVEIGHNGVTELLVVDSMHVRKQIMADRSDAFIALPGGIGTLEELIEAWTWTQLGYHDKPCGLLNVRGYYDKLIAFLGVAVDEGFVTPETRDLLFISDDPAELLERLDAVVPPAHERLVRRDVV